MLVNINNILAGSCFIRSAEWVPVPWWAYVVRGAQGFITSVLEMRKLRF